MSEFDLPGADLKRLDSLPKPDRLADAMRDRPAGDWFRADLEEARSMAQHDPRFKALAAGLECDTLGGRLDAIDMFFKRIEAMELAALVLPPNLSQLRSIFLSSRAP